MQGNPSLAHVATSALRDHLARALSRLCAHEAAWESGWQAQPNAFAAVRFWCSPAQCERRATESEKVRAIRDEMRLREQRKAGAGRTARALADKPLSQQIAVSEVGAARQRTRAAQQA